MNTTQWIKTSECAPTEADLPVWAWYEGMAMPSTFQFIPPEYVTHWRPAKADIPAPPKEETQAEKDDAAFHAWYHDDGTIACGAHMTTWHAAIAWERSQVAGVLPDMQTASWYTLKQAIGAIRVRCEGRGQ